MIGPPDNPSWFDWRGQPLLTPRRLFGCMGIVMLVALVCFLALYLEGLRRERIIAGYLAEVGVVRATYESVDAFMQREFPPGISRQDVIAKLDAKFIHAFAHWAGPDDSLPYFTVCFPEKGCSEESFRQHLCRGPCYSFFFDGDALERVVHEVS